MVPMPPFGPVEQTMDPIGPLGIGIDVVVLVKHIDEGLEGRGIYSPMEGLGPLFGLGGIYCIAFGPPGLTCTFTGLKFGPAHVMGAPGLGPIRRGFVPIMAMVPGEAR
jgi:hypothetical protein